MALVTERELEDYDVAHGADDFALKPPNPTELALRVTQLLRRLRGREGSETIHSGDLVIDQTRYEVTVSGHRVLLTFKEYELLRLLAQNPGRVFSREELLSRVWGYEYFGGTRTVDVHVRRLRSKVQDANHTFIETVWNVGYRFKPVA
ncbi:Transcriptional regulatory protein GlnR [Geodia barretti]|uniref:Transcriptional regulatory protein GlnR n=1 Tax=Geodia barretti TaxID=519541 RepID=A0AA35RSX1_GEOBA|nr:Transcriptional regulatory protein GlnR [Geodia barretti]